MQDPVEVTDVDLEVSMGNDKPAKLQVVNVLVRSFNSSGHDNSSDKPEWKPYNYDYHYHNKNNKMNYNNNNYMNNNNNYIKNNKNKNHNSSKNKNHNSSNNNNDNQINNKKNINKKKKDNINKNYIDKNNNYSDNNQFKMWDPGGLSSSHNNYINNNNNNNNNNKKNNIIINNKNNAYIVVVRQMYTCCMYFNNASIVRYKLDSKLRCMCCSEQRRGHSDERRIGSARNKSLGNISKRIVKLVVQIAISNLVRVRWHIVRWSLGTHIVGYTQI